MSDTSFITSRTKQIMKGKMGGGKKIEPGPESVLFLALFQVVIHSCQKLASRRNSVNQDVQESSVHVLDLNLACGW